MADVFISYSRRDGVAAQEAARTLRDRGFAVWLDSELPGHGSFGDAIERQLAEAKAVLAIWSKDAVASEWVRAEANRGREARKLVQLSLDSTPLPLPFDQIQCTFLPGWTGDASTPAWLKVVGSIEALVNGSDPAASPRAAQAAGPAPVPERRLAVLAFDNISSDPEMSFFSDGVADEIQQTLARSPGMKVLARSSTFQFRGAEKAVRNVAEQLQVTHLLDGSVRRAGHRVRINAQLVDCVSGHPLWSETFNRDLDDIFALQDEIAETVAKALEVVFSPPRTRVEMSIPTYELYLKAQSIISEGARLFDDSGAAAAPLLEQVLSEAPHHARAWELLAACRAWTLRSGRRTGPYEEGRAGVVEAARAALRLDPTSAGAYEALALLEPWGAHLAREALLEKAIRARPNDPSALTAMSTFCWGVGRVTDALRYAERACELNPVFPAARLSVAQMHAYVGNEEASVRMLAELHQRWPNNAPILGSLLTFSASLGYRDVYLAAVGDIAGFAGAERNQLEMENLHATRILSDDPGPRNEMLEGSRSWLAARGSIPLHWLVVLCHYDFADQALEMAERSSYAHMVDPDGPLPSGTYPGTIFGPWCTMNRDTRFVDLCDRLGLCAYWADSHRWPDCAQWLPYDLKAEVRRRRTSSAANR